jgi:hypothetical protein
VATINTTLRTVADYLSDAHTLLLDKVVPYRYDDDSLLVALNVTILEVRRLRPDLIVYKYGSRVPYFTSANTDAEVCIEEAFRLAVLYGLIAHALSRDQEEVQDSRAATFRGAFTDILTGRGVRALAGGVPASGGES